MSNILINKWEVIVRTKRQWVFFLHRGGGEKRKDLWMRDEHEHGKSEENNGMFCVKEIVGNKVYNPEVTFHIYLLSICPQSPKNELAS